MEDIITLSSKLTLLTFARKMLGVFESILLSLFCLDF